MSIDKLEQDLNTATELCHRLSGLRKMEDCQDEIDSSMTEIRLIRHLFKKGGLTEQGIIYCTNVLDTIITVITDLENYTKE